MNGYIQFVSYFKKMKEGMFLRDVISALREYKNNRIDEIVNHIALTPEYKKITQDIKTAYENILKNSNDNLSGWLEKYEEMILGKEDIVFQNLYQQAFADGLDVGILIGKILFKVQK